MSDEMSICAAALFRSKGKDAMTPKEMRMYISLDLKWMSAKEADALIAAMISSGAMKQAGGYIRPGADYSGLQVPIAYRPSEALRKAAATGKQPAKIAKTQTPPAADSEDMFPKLVALSGKYGWDNRGKFISECNSIKRKLSTDIAVAALLVLRDSGADVKALAGEIYEKIAVH